MSYLFTAAVIIVGVQLFVGLAVAVMPSAILAKVEKWLVRWK